MRTHIVLLLVTILACSASDTMVLQKLDAPLRTALDRVDDTSAEQLGVLVQCTGTISEGDRTSLEQTGCTVRTVAGDIATVRATKSQIAQLSQLEIVTLISLSNTSAPIN